MKRFPSIHSNKDFQIVYHRGKSAGNRTLVMYIFPNQTEKNRLGISVSKKVGNSIVRHRISRQLREIFRLNSEKVLQGYEIVTIVKVAAADTDYHKLEAAYLHLCKIQGILK